MYPPEPQSWPITVVRWSVMQDTKAVNVTQKQDVYWLFAKPVSKYTKHQSKTFTGNYRKQEAESIDKQSDKDKEGDWSVCTPRAGGGGINKRQTLNTETRRLNHQKNRIRGNRQGNTEGTKHTRHNKH